MEIILKFDYARLRNEAHVEYGETVGAILAQHDPKASGFDPQYQPWKQALDIEVSLLDAIRKSEHTAGINEQDHLRDTIFRGLVDAVKSALHHFDPGKRSAAEKLQLVFDNYGNIAARSLDAETAAIDDLLRELADSCKAEITLLALADWTAQLDAENRKFKELMAARYAESAARPTTRMRNARLETDRTFRLALNQINALALVNGTAQYETLIRGLNAVSERYKNQIAQAAGRRHKKEETAE